MTSGLLHVISTGKQRPNQLAGILQQIHPFVDFIHVREKERTAKAIYEIVLQLKDRGVPLEKIIVNDRTDVAAIAKTRGVQLAHHSMPLKLAKTHFPQMTMGSSVHSVEEARIAELHGADYVLFGHIYSTHSKPGSAPRGLEELKAVSEAVSILHLGADILFRNLSGYLGPASVSVRSGF